MKILAPHGEIIRIMTGCRATRGNDIDIPEYFPPFESDDETGPPHLFEAPAVPFPLIIECCARSSQFERTAACHTTTPVFAVAADGRGFHGQNRRKWKTGAGNLYLCARFPIPKIECTPLYQIIPCIAVTRSLPEKVQIKWPNDIIIYTTHAKAGGCLTSATAHPAALTFGIGLNIAHAPDIHGGFDLPAAALLPMFHDCHENILGLVLRRVMENLARTVTDFLDAPDACFDEYMKKQAFIGTRVSAYDAESMAVTAEGIMTGITRDMKLQIDGRTIDSHGIRMRPVFKTEPSGKNSKIRTFE